MKIDCVVGLFRDTLTIPREPFTLVRNGVEMAMDAYFSEASPGSAGTPQVDLRIDYNRTGRYASTMPTSVGTSMSSLQAALSVLVGNPWESSSRPRVGMVMADEFPGHPNMLGLMFDTDFDPQSDPTKRLAREGFAVFLDAVYRMRASQGAQAVADEFVFVLVHEMGHIFNLWHEPDPVNFLATSDATAPYGPDAYQFVSDHKKWLGQCDTNLWVRPCGFKWIGGDPWNIAGPTVSGANGAQGKPPVSLRLDTSQREFWPFEPVQLDVTVSLRKGLKRPVVIPDCIDPGYDAFRLFVETPEGERLRYRPSAHFCNNLGTLEIASDRPFRRDISLFGQSGGYTFCRPGVHHVFAVLRLPDGKSVESNAVEVNVRPPCSDDAHYRLMERVLTRPKVAKFLFHRAGTLPPGEEKQLKELSLAAKKQPVAAAIQYSLGRAGMKETRGRGKRAQARRERAREYLKRAIDHKDLGAHRHEKALQMLEGAEE